MESVKDELTCPICLDTLNVPKTLPCLHSFCAECLEPFEKLSRPLCPSCRAEFTFPNGTVSSLPSNFSLINIIEKINSMHQSQEHSQGTIEFDNLNINNSINQNAYFSSNSNQNEPQPVPYYPPSIPIHVEIPNGSPNPYASSYVNNSFSNIPQQMIYPGEWNGRRHSNTITINNSGLKSTPASKSNAGRSGYGGSKGSDGSNGQSGRSGTQTGQSGGSGANGGNGSHGSNGSHGEKGHKGKAGDEMSVLIKGQYPLITILYNNEAKTLDFTKIQAPFSIVANGSNGGDGGHGGNGGAGGNGGTGGDGGRGAEGIDSTPAGSGGAGGDGGNGGNGGHGGAGGDGGDGGDGGNIKLFAADPALFHLFSLSCRGGIGGKSGDGGKGGDRGRGGNRGRNGSNGVYRNTTTVDSRVALIPPPSVGIGKDGEPGDVGDNGPPGHKGQDGRDGEISYCLFDATSGLITERSNKLFAPLFEAFGVQAIIDDGVIEPQEVLNIHSIRLANTGGITLPGGITVSIIPKQNFLQLQESSGCVSHYVPPHQTVMLPLSLNTQVGVHTGLSSFEITASLFGIPFANPGLYSIPNVRYPVHIQQIPPIRTTVGPFPLLFRINNESIFAYGEQAVGHETITYRIKTKEDIRVNSSELVEGIIPLIEPKSAAITEIVLNILPEVPFYKRIQWTIELFFRGRLIQTQANTIENVPKYKQENSDILLLIASRVHHTTIERIIHTTHSLGLTVNFWDAALNNGLSVTSDANNYSRPADWVDQYANKMIVLFADSVSELESLEVSALYKHFYSIDAPNQENIRMPSFLSSLLVIGQLSRTDFVEDFLLKSRRENKCSLITPLTNEEFSDWYTVASVSETHMRNKCKALIEEFKVKNPGAIVRIDVHSYKPQAIKRKLLWKQWSYGSASVNESKFSRQCKIKFLHNKAHQKVQDIVMSNQEIAKAFLECLPLNYQLLALGTQVNEAWNDNDMTARAWMQFVIARELVREIEKWHSFQLVGRATKLIKNDPDKYDQTIASQFLLILYFINYNTNRYTAFMRKSSFKLSSGTNQRFQKYIGEIEALTKSWPKERIQELNVSAKSLAFANFSHCAHHL